MAARLHLLPDPPRPAETEGAASQLAPSSHSPTHHNVHQRDMAWSGTNIHPLGALLWRPDRRIPADRSARGLEACWPFKDLFRLADHVRVDRVWMADLPRAFDDLARECIPAFRMDVWKSGLGCGIHRLFQDHPLFPSARTQVPAGPICPARLHSAVLLCGYYPGRNYLYRFRHL